MLLFRKYFYDEPWFNELALPAIPNFFVYIMNSLLYILKRVIVHWKTVVSYNSEHPTLVSWRTPTGADRMASKPTEIYIELYENYLNFKLYKF